MFWEEPWIHKPHTTKRPTNPQVSLHTYGPSPGLLPRFETNLPSPTSYSHGITRNLQYSTHDYITCKEQPDAYTEDLCNIYRLSNTSLKLSNGDYNIENYFRKYQRLFAFTANKLSTSLTHTLPMPLDIDNGLPGINVNIWEILLQ